MALILDIHQSFEWALRKENIIVKPVFKATVGVGVLCVSEIVCMCVGIQFSYGNDEWFQMHVFTRACSIVLVYVCKCVCVILPTSLFVFITNPDSSEKQILWFGGDRSYKKKMKMTHLERRSQMMFFWLGHLPMFLYLLASNFFFLSFWLLG